MIRKHAFLLIGLAVSLLTHLSLFQTIYSMSKQPARKKYRSSYMAPVQTKPSEPVKEIVEPEPKPEPKQEKIAKVTEKTKVAPRKDLPPPEPAEKSPEQEPEITEDIKPVFGVEKEAVTDQVAAGIGIRVGNTLMKEQEEEYTPPEEVKPLPAISPYELSSLPVCRKKVKPEYPPILEAQEVEGEVLLAVTIDEKGKVVDIEVKSSDHKQFSEAAISAIEKWIFEPATVNGKPVTTKIDIPVTFGIE